MIKYKGYFGQITFDAEAKIFHGEVIGLKDVIIFQGASVDEIEHAFKESIDDYLAWCQQRGEEPERSYSGNILIRMNPALHAHLALEAVRQRS